jgi:mannose-6-phosphate isomerase-like protein (cupin superfamily)
MQTVEISAAEMAAHIARFAAQESQSAHYAEEIGLPREAYEVMAAETLYLMMAPATQGGPMAANPAIVGERGMSVIIARCPPGDKPLLHAHHFTVETFMCLTGKFRIRWGSTGEQQIDLDPHDMIAVPPGVDRQFENITDAEALLLVIITGTGDEDFSDLSMPPRETEFMLENFGQGVIDAYTKIGTAWRHADGRVEGPNVPAPIEVSDAAMAARIARLADMQPLSATSSDSIGVPREARELVAAKNLYLLMAPENQGGPMSHHAAIQGPDNVSVLVAECPPGDSPLLHAHHHTVETFMCLTGRFRIHWGTGGTEHIDLDPYDMIAVPPGVDRRFENVSDADARLLVIITGASRDDYNDISMPPESTRIIRERFGQGVIEAYRQRGVSFREG